jgi:tryptophanyl-tRNA synthetase
MSKSDDTDKGIIFLGDDPEAAAKKVMNATTDSLGSINFNREKQAGVSNLLQISALLSGDSVDKVTKDWQGKSSYGDLKKYVADQVKDFLEQFQSKLGNVDNTKLLKKLVSDEAVMNTTARATLGKVQQAVGLRPRT